MSVNTVRQSEHESKSSRDTEFEKEKAKLAISMNTKAETAHMACCSHATTVLQTFRFQS